jgi:hypothetical protein
LKVLGDPDYLMPSIGTGDSDSVNKWYGSDFSINPNSGQVFFEILFQQGEDYDNKTGLLNPNGDIQFAFYPDDMKVKPKGIVYMLTKVNSHFSKGKFDQTLTGIVPEFVNAGLNQNREATPPANTKDRNNTSASSTPKQLTQEQLAALQAAPGSGSSYKPTVGPVQPNPISKVADDDSSYTAPVGKYANAGRDAPAVNPLTKVPTGKSIMF